MTWSVARVCAATAFAVAALGACNDDDSRRQHRPTPTRIASSWDRFYSEWVKPVVHFGTPMLVVFALLLTLARVLTRVMVTVDSPGPRGAHLRDRARMTTMYWVGVFALLWAAVEATVVLPAESGRVASAVDGGDLAGPDRPGRQRRGHPVRRRRPAAQAPGRPAGRAGKRGPVSLTPG